MKNIHSQTRIAELIKINKDSIDAIASISKPLEKLKNPLIRKFMASRVTIAEAAKMGGASLADFKKALTPLGFYFDEKTAEQNNKHEREKPSWLQKLPAADIIHFDVREMLSRNNDPLKEILKRLKEIKEGQALCIINSFIPVPLISLLEKNNAESFTEIISNKEYHTFFIKNISSFTSTQSSQQNVIKDDEDSFAKICAQFENNLLETDVRHLEMPLPMHTILALLNTLPANKALYVLHKRVPIYLLEELADKNFEIHIHVISETDVRLLIFKNHS